MPILHSWESASSSCSWLWWLALVHGEAQWAAWPHMLGGAPLPGQDQPLVPLCSRSLPLCLTWQFSQWPTSFSWLSSYVPWSDRVLLIVFHVELASCVWEASGVARGDWSVDLAAEPFRSASSDGSGKGYCMVRSPESTCWRRGGDSYLSGQCWGITYQMFLKLVGDHVMMLCEEGQCFLFSFSFFLEMVSHWAWTSGLKWSSHFSLLSCWTRGAVTMPGLGSASNCWSGG
jgi:hypothetical protein